MKSLFFFAAMYISMTACYAQTDTLFNQRDAKGLKQGFWKVMMNEKGINYFYAVESYKDGNRDGLCIYYYSNGKKRDERNFKNGLLHGLSKVYRVYGTLQYTEEYEAGKVNGWKKFYNTDGKLIDAQEYKDGIRTGIYLLYSKNERVVVESYYINGIENGTRKVYSDNNDRELTKEFDFKNGVRTAARFYKNGKLEKEQKFNYEEELKKDEELRNRSESVED